MTLKLAIYFIASAIEAAFKNPKKKAELKTVLLNVRDQINLLYEEPKDAS